MLRSPSIDADDWATRSSSSSSYARAAEQLKNDRLKGVMLPFRKVLSHQDFESYFESKGTVFGFSKPLTLSYFFSVVGAEYCHTYFWIAKDLFWMQGHREYSILFGLSALLWSLIILWHAVRTDNMHELWNYPAVFFWLFANFWWMAGEAHDYEYPYEDPIAGRHTSTSCRLLAVATVWLLIYYCLLLPSNLLPISKAALEEYDNRCMKPRFLCFKHFRQYENLHMLFWIIKDLSWSSEHLQAWGICLIPTILISADLIYLSATSTSSPDYTADLVHFIVTFIWVIGNSVWAFGDFFIDKYSDPQGLLSKSADSLKTARWYSSWILVADVVPVISMYCVWGWLTYSGRLSHFKPPVYEESSSYLCIRVTRNRSTENIERTSGKRRRTIGGGDMQDGGADMVGGSSGSARLDALKEWDTIRARGIGNADNRGIGDADNLIEQENEVVENELSHLLNNQVTI